MVDALAPAKEGTNLQEIASKATAGAETTRSLRSATHGRSQYLQGSDLTGVPDPGAMAVAAILSALAY
jgi:dihydroxyacetone kinase